MTLEPSSTDYDTQEHLGCYVFTPQVEAQRPPKRRRTAASKGGRQKAKAAATQSLALPAETDDTIPFPRLFDGVESLKARRARWEAYTTLWENQERRTNAILASVNEKMLGEVSEFVRSAVPEIYDGKIPTAVILVGPNIASHGPLFAQLATRIQSEERIGPVVVLSSKDAINLKSVLKKLIKDATQEDEGMDDEDDAVPASGKKAAAGKKVKLLNYDLQILQNWCREHEGLKVTIAVQDTEAFDSGILSDLILLFSAYLDRIPFVLLLGVATSVEIFHEKVPKSILRCLRGQKFDVERAEECLAKVFNDAINGTESVLRLGPDLSDFLVRRQGDHTQSIQAFVAALKYAYMSHFYANPLSVILGYMDEPEELKNILQPEHIEAVRLLPSFRRHVEDMLKHKDTTEVRSLLKDDSYLETLIPTACNECLSYASSLSEALTVLEVGRSCMLNQTNKLCRHELYPKALLGELDGGPIVRELLLAMKKMNSTSLMRLINEVTSLNIQHLTSQLGPLESSIISLIAESTKNNLNSEFDIYTAGALRATVVSKRVQLSEKRSALTKEEAEYSRIIQKVHDVVEEYFAENLKSMEGVLLHEVVFYDLLSPHRDVFAPRSRMAIERALSRPQDYLVCDCCKDPEDANRTEAAKAMAGESILPSNPATSILYKLYLESGPLINTFDLWSAFYSVIGGSNVGEGQGDDEDWEDEEGGSQRVDRSTAQALFYRGLAELRFLGFIKHSKKKTDHLAKLAWKGL